MRRTRFDTEICPIARTADLLGDWWTPVVLREFFYGRRRFDEIHEAIGIPRTTLSARLKRLEAEGLIEQRRYEDHPPRFEYRLTAKGKAVWPVLMAMFQFGSDWLFDDDERRATLVDAASGSEVRPVVIDEVANGPIDPAGLRVTLVD